MFNVEALQSKLLACGLPAEGVEYVLNVNQKPAKKVGKRRKRNIILEIPIPRLGILVQAESWSGEHLFLLDLEKPRTVEYLFDQPLAINVQIIDCLGRHTRTTYTADYLAIDGFIVTAYEIKPDDELERLSKERPEDWVRRGDGWHYMPAERVFTRRGIRHVVIPTSSLNQVRADNLRLLSCANLSFSSLRDSKAYKRAYKIVESEGTIRIGDVLDRLEIADATVLMLLLHDQLIFADIDSIYLSPPRDVWVSIDKKRCSIATTTGALLSRVLSSNSLSTAEVIDPRYFDEVALRFSLATSKSANESLEHGKSARTIRRYAKILRESNGDVLALQPKWKNCGPKGYRIDGAHLSYIFACISAVKKDPSIPTLNHAFGAYRNGFKIFQQQTDEFHEIAITRPTFYAYAKARKKKDEIESQGGRRQSNAESDAFDPSNRVAIATRPFMLAHIDHYKCDLFVVVGVVLGKVVTKRPWLTAMVDAYTKEVLAIWLSYGNPSKKACAMVVRDCVRRHGRLPEIIMTDGGSEFKSTHFSVMLATLRVTRAERPPEDPKFGVEVEQMFGAFKERFIRGLPGFGLSIAKSRAVSAALRAEKNAELSLQDLYECFECFMFSGMNLVSKSAGLLCPADRRQQALMQLGCCGVICEFDLKFLIATSIEAPDETYTLWPGRGIHVYDVWFSSPKLLAHRGYKNELTVRLEPYDRSAIYVCIKGKWLVCRSTETNINKGRDFIAVISSTTAHHELRDEVNRIALESDRYLAELISEKLEEIAKKSSAVVETTTTNKKANQDSKMKMPKTNNVLAEENVSEDSVSDSQDEDDFEFEFDYDSINILEEEEPIEN